MTILRKGRYERMTEKGKKRETVQKGSGGTRAEQKCRDKRGKKPNRRRRSGPFTHHFIEFFFPAIFFFS